MSTIFLDVRGSALDPSSSGLTRSQRGNRQTSGPGPVISSLSSFLPGKLNSDVERAKAASQRLLPLIEAILAGPLLKRTKRRKCIR